MSEYQFKKNTRYEIQTPMGFQPFGGIRKLNKDSQISIGLSNGNNLKCSETHKFISSGDEVSANELSIGSSIDGVLNGKVHVTSLESNNNEITLYDVVEVGNGNVFNVDGVVSHNCDFISSGNSVVDLEILEWYNVNVVKEPISKEYYDRCYWRWDYPNFTKDYIIAADVARGDGDDFSAFHVIDTSDMSQVAEYKGKIETEEYGNLLVQVATEWNNALLLIENGSIGWAVIQQVINRNYQNLFYMTEDLKYVDINNQWTNKWNSNEKKATAGFTMSSKTRPLVISKLDLFFREKELKIYSSRTINELMTFIWHNGKAQATKGYNDDLTISLGIALWVYETALVLRNQGISLQRQAVDGIGKTNNDVGIYTTSTVSRKSSTPTKDPYSMDVNGESEDLRWLLK